MAADPELWAQRPIAEDLLRCAAEDVLQLLMLADRITAELGSASLSLLSALSSVYSQSYWNAAHQDAVTEDIAVCLPAFDNPSWMTQLFDKVRSTAPTAA